VTLPAAAGRRSPVAARPAPAGAPPRSRILVIDDEPVVGRVAQRILAAEHDVSLLASAHAARDRLVAGERYDLILCDLMMPELSGMALHAEVVALAPEQARRMVFVTGGAFGAGAQEFLAALSTPWLQKPFDAAALRELVRHVLAEWGEAG